MLSALTWLVYELLSCRFGRFRLHTSLRLRALIRSWQGVYVCKFRSTRTRFQFKKTLPGEHSPENFCCVGPHFQACMNLADVFCLRCFSEARKKHFRRNFRKCSRMRAIVLKGWICEKSLVIAFTSTLQTSSDLNNYNNNKYENICIINNYVSHL